MCFPCLGPVALRSHLTVAGWCHRLHFLHGQWFLSEVVPDIWKRASC